MAVRRGYRTAVESEKVVEKLNVVTRAIAPCHDDARWDVPSRDLLSLFDGSDQNSARFACRQRRVHRRACAQGVDVRGSAHPCRKCNVQSVPEKRGIRAAVDERVRRVRGVGRQQPVDLVKPRLQTETQRWSVAVRRDGAI